MIMLMEKTYIIEEGELKENGVYIFTNRFNLSYNYEECNRKVNQAIYELNKQRKEAKKKGKDVTELSERITKTRRKLMKAQEYLLASILIDYVSEDNIVKIDDHLPSLHDLLSLLREQGYQPEITPLNKINKLLERLKGFGIIDYKVLDNKAKIQVSPFIAWSGKPNEKRDELLSKIVKKGKTHPFSKHPIQTWNSTINYIKERAWEVKYYIEGEVDELIIDNKTESYSTMVVLISPNDVVYDNDKGGIDRHTKKSVLDFATVDITPDANVVHWVSDSGFFYDLMRIIKYIFPNQREHMENLAEQINHDILSIALGVIFNDQESFRRREVK